MTPPAPFRCPFCGIVSHNPTDAEKRYCGRCHVFVDDALGDGVWTWIVHRYPDGSEAAIIAQVAEDCGRGYIKGILDVKQQVRLVTVLSGHDYTGRKMRESDLARRLARAAAENTPRHRSFR